MKRIGGIVGIWMLFSSSMLGQTPDSLFEIARSHNPQLKALGQLSLSEYARLDQVSQLPNMELGLGAFVAPVETRLGPQVARLSATQMFPWFGTFQAKQDQVKAEGQAVHEQLALWEWEAFFQLKKNYFQLYEIEATQQVIQKNLELLVALKEVVTAQVANGVASLADVLRVDLELQAFKKEIEILESTKKRSTIAINQLLNRELDTAISMDTTLNFHPPFIKGDSLSSLILSGHPQIQQLSYRQAASSAAILLNKKEAKPSFGIGVDYLVIDPRQDVAIFNGGQDAIQAKAILSLPLSQKKFKGRALQEEAKIAAIAYQKKEVLSQYLAKVEEALAHYEQAQLSFDLYSQQIETAQAAIRIREGAYSNEGESFEELLDLERELITYELKLLQAIVQSHMAIAEIERVVGKVYGR